MTEENTTARKGSGQKFIPVAYINECPGCGKQFLGMSIVEWRDRHAARSCPRAPLTVAQIVEAERHYSYGGAHGR